ncbi:hypothetical protein D3C81_456950 [compost metagenome]
MPAGLQIVNDYGTLQIDNDYQNYMLRTKGSVTTVAASGGTVTNYSASIQVVGNNPQIFFDVNNGFISTGWRTVSGNVHTFAIFTTTVVTVSYYIFDNDIPAAGNFGMQVFNAAGRLVFDSSNHCLRIAAVAHMPPNISGDPVTVPVSLPAGRKYACALSFSRCSIVQVAYSPFPILGRCYDFHRFLGGSLETKMWPIATFPGQPAQTYPPQTTYPPQAVIIDVTNM